MSDTKLEKHKLEKRKKERKKAKGMSIEINCRLAQIISDE